MINIRTIQATRLFTEIRKFLKRPPIPRTESTRSDLLKLDGFDEERLGPAYRKKLARAIRTCDAYMERLQTAKGVIVGWADLLGELIERKAGLIQEIQRFEIFSVNPGEREDFALDAQNLQERMKFGVKFKAPQRPQSRIPEHLRE